MPFSHNYDLDNFVQDDQGMSLVLMEMWTNFIKIGNPGDFWQTLDTAGQYLRYDIYSGLGRLIITECPV